jgi:hypothetical protein
VAKSISCLPSALSHALASGIHFLDDQTSHFASAIRSSGKARSWSDLFACERFQSSKYFRGELKILVRCLARSGCRLRLLAADSGRSGKESFHRSLGGGCRMAGSISKTFIDCASTYWRDVESS